MSSKMSLYWTTNKSIVYTLVTVYTSTSTMDSTTTSHKPAMKNVVEQKYWYNIYYVLYKSKYIFFKQKVQLFFFIPKED